MNFVQAIIVLKFVFQFDFWSFARQTKADPLNPVTIIGIEKLNNFANYDVALLIALFFHRYVLRVCPFNIKPTNNH